MPTPGVHTDLIWFPQDGRKMARACKSDAPWGMVKTKNEHHTSAYDLHWQEMACQMPLQFPDRVEWKVGMWVRGPGKVARDDMFARNL